MRNRSRCSIKSRVVVSDSSDGAAFSAADGLGRHGDLLKQVCAALKVHVRIEEEIFYPAVRRAIKDKDLMNEAEIEHDSAKTLIRQLERMKPGDPKYTAAFTVLCEYIEHHVKEEDDEMFPKVRRARITLQALGKKLMARKARLAART